MEKPIISERKAKYIVQALRYAHRVDAMDPVDAIYKAVGQILGVLPHGFITVRGGPVRYRVCVRGFEDKYCVEATVSETRAPPIPPWPPHPRRRIYVVTFLG